MIRFRYVNTLCIPGNMSIPNLQTINEYVARVTDYRNVLEADSDSDSIFRRTLLGYHDSKLFTGMPFT